MLTFCRIEHDGTAIGNAIAVATERIKDSKVKSKIIILVTDGENNRGIDPIQGAEIAKAFKVRIYPIAIYNPNGFMQPVDDPIFGTRYVVARPQIDENMMEQIAQTTGGKYFRASDPKAMGHFLPRSTKWKKARLRSNGITAIPKSSRLGGFRARHDRARAGAAGNLLPEDPVMRFAATTFLYLLLLVPGLFLFWAIADSRRRKMLARFGSMDLIRKIGFTVSGPRPVGQARADRIRGPAGGCLPCAPAVGGPADQD